MKSCLPLPGPPIPPPPADADGVALGSDDGAAGTNDAVVAAGADAADD